MSFPDVSDAFWDWTSPVQFQIIQRQVVDYQVEEDYVTSAVFQGVLEPLPTRKLVIKPEGQRQWMWYTLWTTKDLKLDDILRDEKNRQFRVLGKADWQNGGHFEYDVTQEPK